VLDNGGVVNAAGLTNFEGERRRLQRSSAASWDMILRELGQRYGFESRETEQHFPR
jgi:hypothetical protein